MTEPNLIHKLRRPLPKDAARALDAVIQASIDARLALYLVGGSVRDLLLERPTLDLDLTLAGDAPSLARRVAASSPALRCTVHRTFGTATLTGDSFRLDLASARAETYRRPGALPTIQPGNLHDDLRRRDFTVNALALPLTDGRIGALTDPFGGTNDLKAGLLRVLHEKSFQDDATRILRGVRYQVRLDFRFERTTARWLRRDIGYLQTIGGARIRQELLRSLREPHPERIFLRLHRLGALTAIHPALSFNAAQAKAFRYLRGARSKPSPTTGFALLAWHVPDAQIPSLSDRLALTKREREAVMAVPVARSLERKLSRRLKPSRVADLLSALPTPSLTALAAAGDGVRLPVQHYLQRDRYLKPRLDGQELLRMGAAKGPRLGEVLRRLKAARLDGEVRSRSEEEALARRLLGLPPAG